MKGFEKEYQDKIRSLQGFSNSMEVEEQLKKSEKEKKKLKDKIDRIGKEDI